MANISDEYGRMTPIEHILHFADMYVGSMTNTNMDTYVANFNENGDICFNKKNIDVVPAFLNIFNEILVNVSDHYIRTNGAVKKAYITVTPDSVTIENDGKGIPVIIHDIYKKYIPELIFSDLHSGQNYKKEKKIVGGQYGLGAKLVNIFSNKFILETSDGNHKYIQTFSKNLSNISKAKITKCKKNYTKITFYPDFNKFNITNIDDILESLFLKRCADISAYCPNLNVYYNNKLIKIKNYNDYIKKHLNDNIYFYDKLNNGWEIGITKSNNGIFEQMSMVNAIFTIIGGTHVDVVSNMIIKQLTNELKKKYKNLDIKPNDIKNNLFLFVNSKVENPKFDTQTKENLVTKIKDDIELSPSFIKNIIKSPIIEDIVELLHLKEKASLKKISKGKKSNVKIKKLDDANKAGTNKSKDCTLFLSEGDSAQSMIISGFESVGRDYFGCLSLKGKILNVRDININKIKTNEEIINIVNAIGLEFGKKYKNLDELRYGKIVFAMDSDCDGMHIKGLLINFFDLFFPELLKLGIFYELITPIVKAEKGKDVKYFYKLKDYNRWKETKSSKNYFITYYKGLGTIEPHEAKYFFSNLNKHLIKFEMDDIEKTKNIINLIFDKKRSDDRKEWQLNNKPIIVDKFGEKTTFESFFNNEFIDYSLSDNIRNIPNVIDGLKPTQRKVLYTLFKRDFKNKTKVSQLTGAIIEESSYHHGNVSLENTIIKMAQNYIGSNNENFLEPLGMFGTRLKGGTDAASARYIFTKLNDLTRMIYHKIDDKLLDYLNDDGFKIEPKYYVPIVPTILINGANGVGTGWSTDVPNYKLEDIIKYLKNKIFDRKNNIKLEPYYNNFKGNIIYDKENGRYITTGIIKKLDENKYKISELPIGMWTKNYYEILETLIENKIIKSYIKNDTDTNVDIIIKFHDNVLNDKDIYNILKLKSYINYTNMYLFDIDEKIKKFDDVYDIIDYYYEVRYEYYRKRIQLLLDELEHKLKISTNKLKFLMLLFKDDIKIYNKNKIDIENILLKFNIEKINDNFDYILNIPFFGVTKERIELLKNEILNIKNEIKNKKSEKIENIWIEDLNKLLKFITK